MAVMHGWSFEHQCPPSDRSTEAPPPALSPLRTAWVAADTPWFRVCARFIRRAQAGAVSVVVELVRLAATQRSGLTIAEGNIRHGGHCGPSRTPCLEPIYRR